VLFKAEPNPAHIALAELERMGALKATVTQNIDALHQRAGSKNVIEVHGDVRSAVCVKCGTRYSADYVLKELLGEKRTPTCKCGGVLKPNTVMFGEPLPEEALSEAFRLAKECDLLIVVGSSLVVYPIAFMADIAKRSGGKLAIINTEKTAYDSAADVVIHGKAEEILPKLVQAVKELTEK
nr:Sir2 family NAD-dependent protein deacetylase [Candidatus Freyrarchaeum guaymaensis]